MTGRSAAALGAAAVVVVAVVAAVVVAARGGADPTACLPRGTGAGAVVALVDSGLAPHPGGPSPAPGSASLVPGEGVGADGTGHGTDLAAIVHRLAPEADLVAVKVVDTRGGVAPGALAAGVRAATQAGADVVLLAQEAPAPDPELAQALRAAGGAGALVVVAAGNEALDLDRWSSDPASADVPAMLVVAAAGPDGALAARSNRGGPVDVAAPGVDVPGGGGRVVSGSSPAAAVAAGLAARLRGALPDLAVAEAHDRLVASGREVPTLAGQAASGRVLSPEGACP